MNIYVSNVSFYTTEENLKTLFSEFGFVNSVKIIHNGVTNDEKDIAFISMPLLDEANAAILGMNNKEIEGTTLSVEAAKESGKFTELNLLHKRVLLF